MRKDQRTWQLISLEVGLLLVYFATRLFHLTLLPMFVDEATYMLWALNMGREGSFVGSSEASKLTIWVMSLVLPFFVGNLLWAGRYISVIVGMLGLIGCYLLGRRLFGRRVGLIGAMLYLIVPYVFFYDRLAIMDGVLTTLVIYLVLISLQFTQQPNLRYSVALGVMLMLLILAKFNGFVYGLLPLLWILITSLPRSKRGLAWMWVLLAYSLGALGFIPSLINSSYVGRAWDKLGIVSRPDRPFWWNWPPNLSNSLDTLVQNLSLPIFIIACVGLVLVLIQHRRYGLLMIGCISVTLIPFVVAPKPWAWYPRYLLPVAPFLFLVAAYAINQGIDWLKPYLNIRTRVWRYGVIVGLVLIIIGPALRFDYWLVGSILKASMLAMDLPRRPTIYGVRYHPQNPLLWFILEALTVYQIFFKFIYMTNKSIS